MTRTCDDDQYTRFCKDEFAQINAKLDRIDGFIGGNGNDGARVRLDRLERAEQDRFAWMKRADDERRKMIWVLLTAIVGLVISQAWRWVSSIHAVKEMF